MSGDAPWLGDPSLAPDRLIWRQTGDGIRLRLALWLGGSKGTVLLFPGRTEAVEKYANIAQALTAAGLAVIAIDWRGQGLSDRLAQPASMGHVHHFADYQHDVAALVAQAQESGLPRPWHLLAHSMGGAIGLRALHHGLPVQSAAFCAPMWGIAIPPGKRTLAWMLSTAARLLRLDARFAPGEGPDCYAATAPFEGNLLTSDPTTFARLQDHLRQHPELALGGASLGWLGAALWEMRALTRHSAPDLPALAVLGTDEAIVVPDRIRHRMADWPEGELVEYRGARHELLMEVPAVRDAVIAQVLALFARAAT